MHNVKLFTPHCKFQIVWMVDDVGSLIRWSYGISHLRLRSDMKNGYETWSDNVTIIKSPTNLGRWIQQSFTCIYICITLMINALHTYLNCVSSSGIRSTSVFRAWFAIVVVHSIWVETPSLCFPLCAHLHASLPWEFILWICLCNKRFFVPLGILPSYAPLFLHLRNPSMFYSDNSYLWYHIIFLRVQSLYNPSTAHYETLTRANPNSRVPFWTLARCTSIVPKWHISNSHV
jgi:hypothetical protein